MKNVYQRVTKQSMI